MSTLRRRSVSVQKASFRLDEVIIFREVAKSQMHVSLLQVNYSFPKLEWFQIYRGTEDAGKRDIGFRLRRHNDPDHRDLNWSVPGQIWTIE